MSPNIKADLDIYTKHMVNDNNYSLCYIPAKNQDSSMTKSMLKRCADLDMEGNFKLFKSDPSLDKKFDNRDYLYFDINKEVEYDSYSIWSWTFAQNHNDMNKDYISSKKETNLSFIEVIRYNGNNLINDLQQGIEHNKRSNRLLFCYPIIKDDQQMYRGILVNQQDIVANNTNKIILREDCFNLPMYEFSEDSILEIDSKFFIYKKIFAGVPINIRKVKNKIEITKYFILNSISWNSYKLKTSILKKNYQEFRNFLQALPTDDVKDKLKEFHKYSDQEAQDDINSFLQNINDYIDSSNTIEDQILQDIIKLKYENDDQDKYLVKSSDNNSLDNNKNLEISDNNSSIDDDYHDNKDLEISDNNLPIDDNNHNNKNLEISDNSLSIDDDYHDNGEGDDDYLSILNMNLEDAGVDCNYSNSLALFLCAAFIEKQSLLLVGPNAIDIIKAFSATFNSKKISIISCDDTLQIYDNLDAQIVVINNILTSKWINNLPEILSNKDVFYIVTHPYKEDLLVEPYSLYNYVLPLFTEFFITEKPKNNSYQITKYDAPSIIKTIDNSRDKDRYVLSNLKVSSLVKNNIKQIKDLMTSMDNNFSTTDDDRFLFNILPIAYATMSSSKLNDLINNHFKISKDLKESIQYILEDNSDE